MSSFGRGRGRGGGRGFGGGRGGRGGSKSSVEGGLIEIHSDFTNPLCKQMMFEKEAEDAETKARQIRSLVREALS